MTHHKLDLKAKSELSEIGRIIQQFKEFSDQRNLGQKVRQTVSIALDELLNNIISYGFKDTEEHIIHITMDYSESRLVITVKDNGPPFNPFAQRPPDTSLSVDERDLGGLGILLVKNLMTEVSYHRGQHFNIVTLTLDATP